MDEYTSIFVESNEDMGILYDSYESLLPDTNSFLDKIEKYVNQLNSDPDKLDMDLKGDITDYKAKAMVKCKPAAIELKKIKSLTKKIKDYQSKLESTLSRFAKIKDSIAYGGSFSRAILHRPKVYSKEISEEKYGKINEAIRNVNRAMDWCEKVLIDLFNMTDQDLNILEIIDKVYAKKKIYEHYEMPKGVIEEDTADSVIPMNPSAGYEASWHNATHDKKTGTAAPYIKRNHDMANYGEDDVNPDEYKRPSAENDDSDDEEEIQKDTGMAGNTTPDSTGIEEPKEHETSSAPTSTGGTNNYYYYTYNNSLNKSHRDDHSVHTRTTTDDHSTGKHINSDNGLSAEDIQKIKKDDGMDHKLESAAPWELNLGIPEPMMEAVGDADDMKPESDHPIKDIATDIDRKTTKVQQKAKKAVQDTVNAGRAIAKPVVRTRDWISNMVVNWRDADETKVKEKMADPQQRKGLFNALRKAIRIGALAKAGLLLNPVILFLTVTKKIGDKKNSYRLRNEMIGELKTEMEVIDEKIKDAEAKGDNKAKYKLMRFKNEVNKKLLRVGGGTRWDKVI